MTGADRTDDWERIARQTLWQSLTRLGDDATHATDDLADAVYWGHDLDREQVERLRQLAFDLQFAAEEYLARLCADAEPWADDEDRTPSWQPVDARPTPMTPDRGSDCEAATDPDASHSTRDAAPDSTTDAPSASGSSASDPSATSAHE